MLDRGCLIAIGCLEQFITLGKQLIALFFLAHRYISIVWC